MEQITPPAGPYLSTQDAAAYLSFNYDHFRMLARKHQIPRRGPSKNRFAVTDLDRWMTDPHCFWKSPNSFSPKNAKFKPSHCKEGTV
jgi:excisionase family DNA binding protein